MDQYIYFSALAYHTENATGDHTEEDSRWEKADNMTKLPEA